MFQNGIGDILTKTIKQLSKEIAEHLGIDPLPIKYEDLVMEEFMEVQQILILIIIYI